MKKSLTQILFLFFKILVVAGAYGFIAFRFITDDDLQTVLNGGFSASHWFFLVCVIALMPINWLLESFKWRVLLADVEHVPWHKAFFSVLAGLSVAIFTPNRIGEYVGRIWVLRARNRIAGIALTMAGSMAQSCITFFVGVICAWFWLVQRGGEAYIRIVDLGFATLLVAVVFILFLLIPQISTCFLRLKLHRYLQSALERVAKLSFHVLASALAISLLRYSVFVIQFILLLIYFQTGMSLTESLLSIGLLYGSMLIIPTIAIAEPGVRGSLSLLIFGVFSSNSSGILAASLTLWIINLALPALVGAVYLAAFKMYKS